MKQNIDIIRNLVKKIENITCPYIINAIQIELTN
jgi:hypothetical protein